MTTPQESPDEALRLQRDRFVAFAFASADILIELDEKGNIQFVDGTTRGMLGVGPKEMIGQNLMDFLEERSHDTLQLILSAPRQTSKIEEMPVRLKAGHGRTLPFVMSGFRLPDLKNHFYLSFSVVRTGHGASHEDDFDQRTGLLKKEGFAEVAASEVAAGKLTGKPMQLGLINMPEFTSLLDSLDRDKADALLADISNYLRKKSLGGDSAGILKDDAYSLIHDKSLDSKELTKDLHEMTAKADPKGVGIVPQFYTVSLDAGKLSEEDSARAVVHAINSFAEKAGEAFTLSSLTQSYNALVEETVKKISDFRKTVSEEAFQVAFQPIVDLHSGVIHHFESLVRFDPDSGFDNPFKFITFGEEAGIISDFDLAMTQRTVEILQEYAKNNKRPVVAVNLSGKSLSSDLFMNALRKILANNTGLRRQLIFEVTESAKIKDLKTANAFIQELRAEGSQCCLDDFGVGESSFDYLRHLQVDFVKIDGSYVKESITTPRGVLMLKAMSNLCKELGIVTIGEMIEDEKIMGLLSDCGVEFGQGYFFGKPTTEQNVLGGCGQVIPVFNKLNVVRAKKIRQPTGRAWWAKKE
ncbi:MAG: EAL domain-containing protein [Alphaproteobacteria bacterium]|nr:EAL domain-containing protein [Alphaproteobacteria bacterium]